PDDGPGVRSSRRPLPAPQDPGAGRRALESRDRLLRVRALLRCPAAVARTGRDRRGLVRDAVAAFSRRLLPGAQARPGDGDVLPDHPGGGGPRVPPRAPARRRAGLAILLPPGGNPRPPSGGPDPVPERAGPRGDGRARRACALPG